MASTLTILLVEDNPDDAALTERALGMGAPANLEVAREGEEALEYLLSDANELPQLVLLDLRLGSTDGLEVLRRMREHPRTRTTPVVILTSSLAPGDVAAAYRYGVNSYVRKPSDFEEFAGLMHQVGAYWLRINEPPPNSDAH